MFKDPFGSTPFYFAATQTSSLERYTTKNRLFPFLVMILTDVVVKGRRRSHVANQLSLILSSLFTTSLKLRL